MAILGRLIDQQTVVRAHDVLSQTIALSTLSHSLPATNPEIVLPILRSVEESYLQEQVPSIVGMGGNASLLTVGYAIGSATSCPAIMYDVVAQVFHSIIR